MLCQAGYRVRWYGGVFNSRWFSRVDRDSLRLVRILNLILLSALCWSARAEQTPDPDPTAEAPSPHEVRVWADSWGWHFQWHTQERQAVFEGDLILRGPGSIERIQPFGADSTALRLEAADRRIRFRARCGGLAQGFDVIGTGKALSCRITINGMESRESVYLSATGNRQPPGFPFLVHAAASSQRFVEPFGAALIAESTAKSGEAAGPPPLRIGIDEAWSPAPLRPPAGTIALALDELGWCLIWPDAIALEGWLLAPGGTIRHAQADLDTLKLDGMASPLRFRTSVAALEAQLTSEGAPMPLQIGPARLLEPVARMLIVGSE